MEQTRTVLLVDDEQDVLDTVTSYLSQQGFQVVTASRWTEAIAQFQETPPDIVLLDLYLPTVQGEALLEFIRELDKELPVIIISSAIDAGKIEDLGRLGANGFVQKPFETDDLLVVLEQVLAEQTIVSDEPAADGSGQGDIQEGFHALPTSPSSGPQEALAEPSPAQVSPGAGAEALQRERQATLPPPAPRRRRSLQKRARRFKQVKNYILSTLLFFLIVIVFWIVKQTITSTGLFGIGISTVKEQVE